MPRHHHPRTETRLLIIKAGQGRAFFGRKQRFDRRETNLVKVARARSQFSA